MLIYDISQEVFSCEVYPDDDIPQKYTAKQISKGDPYNLTNFSMCAHNGTHIDAPYHFINDGITVERIPLYKTIGPCFVALFQGILETKDAENIIYRAKAINTEASRRLLLKGNPIISIGAAKLFAAEGLFLIGAEAQTVGEETSQMDIHKILLKNEIVILEGIRLNEIDEGVYFLNAAPLSLRGIDGAPCRAVLIKE